MLDFLFGLLIWAAVGGLPGFYAAYAKNHDPRLGMAGGALVSILIGEVGTRLGLIDTLPAAGLTIIGLVLIAVFLVPEGNYRDNASLNARITVLAYALSIPTIVIVLGIVIFPLVWNGIFSLRPIETGDLANVELFDLSDISLENFDAQMGFRIDPLPCETDDSGACLTDDEGNIEYPRPRTYFDDARTYRYELNRFYVGEDLYITRVRNDEFYPMILRTLFYTLASTTLAITVGLVIALVVRDAFPGRNIFRGFILFPYIAPVISVAFIWRFSLLPNNGLIENAFDSNISYVSTSETFLGIPVPLLTVILFQTWRYFPFAFLFLLARLQAVPDDLYEAAKVDGATPLQRLRHITMPQLRAVIGTLFVLRFIWTFNKFDDVFLLTGPIEDTKVIPVQIFETLFTEQNPGEASAIAVIMAFILAVILLIYFKFFLVEED